MAKAMTATQARKNFFKLLEEAGRPGGSVMITHEGLPKVVVMSVDEFEGWIETLEIMSDPELVKGIAEGEADVKAGRVIPWTELKRKLRKKK